MSAIQTQLHCDDDTIFELGESPFGFPPVSKTDTLRWLILKGGNEEQRNRVIVFLGNTPAERLPRVDRLIELLQELRSKDLKDAALEVNEQGVPVSEETGRRAFRDAHPGWENLD